MVPPGSLVQAFTLCLGAASPLVPLMSAVGGVEVRGDRVSCRELCSW